MKKTALTAAIIAAAMVITPAAAKGSSRFNENRDRGQITVHHLNPHHSVVRHYFLPKRVIKSTLYHRGYRNINIVRFKNGHYVVRANGHRGLVRLRVNARTGVVVKRTLIKPYPKYTNKKPGVYFHWRLH